MKKRLIGIVAVIAAIGFALYSGYRDGQEHRTAPAAAPAR